MSRNLLDGVRDDLYVLRARQVLVWVSAKFSAHRHITESGGGGGELTSSNMSKIF